jgi:hypothetical protein
VSAASTQCPRDVAADIEAVRPANLAEFLLEYSLSMSGISIKNRRRQLLDRLRIQGKYFDPSQAKAWLGVARTLAMFAVPRGMLSAYRAEQDLRVQPS